MQIPILSGIAADPTGDYRTTLPRNYVPTPKEQGISAGYLKPADGLVQFAAGPGIDRGGILWRGQLFRVMGSKLVTVDSDGAISVVGDVGSGALVTLDYSFDRLMINSGQALYYWDGLALTQVTDSDLGPVVDVTWVDGYTLTTDGTSLIVCDLNNPTAVNPLKYGSAEADPDPVMAVKRIRRELWAVGRNTCEVFQNVGGDGFPFQRIDGAQVQKGAVGTRMCCVFAEAMALVGGARNEPPSVWLCDNGQATSISTREVDTLLQDYTEDQLAACLLEARVHKQHQHLLMHLPDRTLVYDLNASQVFKEPVWYELGSTVVGHGQYRARGWVWAYDRWVFGDPQAARLGVPDETVSTHYGDTVGWDFGTLCLYNESRGAIVHELELVGLPGRVALGAAPVIWTSYSLDGETWSQERAIRAGGQGNRTKRLIWTGQGPMNNVRMQRFRGTSDAHIAFARLEARIEPLAV